MNKITLCIVVILGLISLTFGSSAVRFVNALEGATIDIHSTELDTIHLDYMEASTFTSMPSGQIHVTNVVDSNTQDSYTNGQSLLITFDFYATVAIISNGATAILALFNETNAANSDDSKAWIRVIDLATSNEFVNFATIEGTFAAYVGPMVTTQYQSISPSDNQLRIFDSATGSYNTPMVSQSISMDAGSAYTVFYFTPESGAAASFYYDQAISGAIIPPPATSTSGSLPSSTSGSTSDQSSSPSPSTSSQTLQNSSSQMGILVMLSMIAAILAF